MIFQIPDGTVKLSARDQGIRKSTLIRDYPTRGEHHKDVHQGESDGSQPSDKTTDDSEARNDFGSIEGKYLCRRHVEPRVKLCVPREKHHSPLRYTDVIRRTHTTLDVLQESRIGDHWNTVRDRNVSEPWTGFTQFTILSEKPS